MTDINNSLLTKEELLSAVNGVQLGNAPCFFNDVQTDSRNIQTCEEKYEENYDYKSDYTSYLDKKYE